MTRFVCTFLLVIFGKALLAQRTDHPRLFVTTDDLPTLRTWATTSNPFYQNGLKALAETVMEQVQSGVIPAQDTGGSAYSNHYTEGYAHLLAFMSLVESNPALAQNYRTTAISLLMYVIDIADLGVLDEGTAQELRFRRLSFSTSDRSRWIGQAFPLAVDWLYDYLTAEQKRKIRRVFLRWAEENLNGYPNHNYFREGPPLTISPSNYNSPIWLDLTFDPIKKRAIRYAMNNYFNAHIRNVVMMGAAFDSEDDIADRLVPNDYNGRLREYRGKFLHTWHYMSDYAYRYENNGGVSAEGGEYMPALGFTLQLLLALHTAGYDPAEWGEKIDIDSNPHWEKTIPALINSIPPKRTYLANRGGWNYQPSWFGDGEHLHLPDITRIFGPYGVYARLTNKSQQLESIRWILAYTPPGSIEDMIDRIDSKEEMTHSILTFMTFDPAAANQVVNGFYPSPHNSIPTYHFAKGAGRINNRTSWELDASWVNYRLGFIVIDHQHGDGNMFDFYRKGEWLTKERTGYGNTMGCSDYKNTLAIKSNTDAILTSGVYGINALRGSQYRLRNDGDPQIVSTSYNNEYLSVTGDATNLYNYLPDWGDAIRNVQHASRSLMWLKPDFIVVYDRVETNYNGFKQFWLNLPSATPTVSGKTITANTPGGQRLVISNLLPAQSEIDLISSDPILYTGAGIGVPEPYPADYDPMGLVEETNVPGPYGSTITLWHPMRVRIQAEGNPLSTRFLNVLQGRDSDQQAVSTNLVVSNNNRFEGAAVGTNVVLFKRNLSDVEFEFSIDVPDLSEIVNITGLNRLTQYSITSTVIGSGLIRISLSAGSGYTTDDGGVLTFAPQVTPKNILSVVQPISIAVPLHTAFENLPLPTEIEVTFNDGTTGTVRVVFNSTAYNSSTQGSYVLSGTIITSNNITNTENLDLSITVIVEQEQNGPPTNIILSSNQFIELQPIGTIVAQLNTLDPNAEDTHTYSLLDGDDTDQNSLYGIDGNRLICQAVVDVTEEQTHSIRIQSVDQIGNQFSKSFLIRVLPDQVFIPTLFSPNGDGMNDVFRVRSNSIETITVKVFDRMGILMFETKSLEEATQTGWDGKYKGGDAPSGVYSWSIEGRLVNGEALKFNGSTSGNILLIR